MNHNIFYGSFAPHQLRPVIGTELLDPAQGRTTNRALLLRQQGTQRQPPLERPFPQVHLTGAFL